MRRPGIKPGSRPWQGRILSLYYRRTIFVLRFERRISRVLGERHNQARPYEQAFNEDRTRDLALTKRMLCQLSYEGETRADSRPAAASARRCRRGHSGGGWHRSGPRLCVHSTRVVFNPSKVKIRVRVPVDAFLFFIFLLERAKK